MRPESRESLHVPNTLGTSKGKVAVDSHRLCRPDRKTLVSAGIAVAGLAMVGCAVPSPPPPTTVSAPTAPASNPPQPSTSDSNAPGVTRVPSTVTATPTAQNSRCHTTMLAASFANPDAGAGQRSVDLVLRNTGSQTCDLFGYPGMQLLDSDGRAVPTTIQRTADPLPKLVTLAPGAQVVSTLAWTVINSGGEGNPCEPTADHAQVTPPDEQTQLVVDWSMGPVCDQGAIRITAFR